MKLIIHRGTAEIGGTCVEVFTEKSRIVIDFGLPLVNAKKEPFDSKVLIGKSPEELRGLKILPSVSGLYKDEERSVDAILISHSHMDHYGLLRYVHPGIPIYMSEGAKTLVEVSDIFTPHKTGKINTKIIDKRKKLTIGDFEIFPYLVDHSAFDALAFMIKADGKKIFYSGDFRGHGRKSELYRRMVSKPPKDIDCLLLEGSMIGRGEQLFKDEQAVQARMEKVLKATPNIKFLFASSQNIDRIVSAYKACLKTNHVFVIDIYTAYILDCLRKVSKNIPQFNWRNIRVKFMKSHADSLAQNASVKLLYAYNSRKIEIDEINAIKDKVLMLARDNSIFPILVKNIKGIEGAKIIYSMWEGYLTDKFKDFVAQKGLDIETVHTSGHATIQDLKVFAEALNPGKLIPIHTFESGQYPKLFRNVQILQDREVFNV
ncbi:MAG TPA: MBL fold metallo-hydrolase [Candidatus Omnitrophota bacterium]|nr:MBL fold metallo-hydrolase [Candidatus Omnitrophota bacterium]HRZ14776.1 MBL fold metallo-hydrolase [Candidatus Omnitrophota bacterium]